MICRGLDFALIKSIFELSKKDEFYGNLTYTDTLFFHK